MDKPCKKPIFSIRILAFSSALAFSLLACRSNIDTWGRDKTGSTQERCSFSLAILTDLHLGEDEDDHGTPGWDDVGGTGGVNATVLSNAVAQINALAEEREDLAFVMVLGDLSDSGERSELVAARSVLAGLTLPWFPLLGNHDTWPYAWNTASECWNEADFPVGDAQFWDVFDDVFKDRIREFSTLVRAETVLNPETNAEISFVDYAFDFCGAHIVSLDTNTRVHAGGDYPGIGPEASLNDFEGGLWPWFKHAVLCTPAASASRILVFSHHPFLAAGDYTFTEEAFAAVDAFLEENGLGPRIGGFFAGHIHLDSEQHGPAGVPVVISEATKDGRAPLLVSVSEEGEVAWDVK